MQLPFEAFIGLRYLCARRRNSFISFISLVSVAGIALGVAALIVVLSVMNGFQKEVRAHFLGIVSHIELSGYEGRLPQWPTIDQLVRRASHVVAAAPYVNGQALLSAAGNAQGAVIRGVDPIRERTVIDIDRNMVKGSLSALQPRKFGILLGAALARQLGVSVGDRVTLVTPQGGVTPVGMMPRLKQFTIVGVFRAAAFNWDASLAMIHIADSQVLFRLGSDVSGLRLKLDDAMVAPEVKHVLQTMLPRAVVVSDWTEMNADYFRAVQVEKRMMALILVLIVAVAAFNLVSTLVMVVTDKQADIAILRTLGAAPASITRIFVIQGSVSGVMGTLSGVVLGLLICWNMASIFAVIEYISGQPLISADIYGIDYLPTDVKGADIIIITAISLLLTLLATIYPSWRAARTHPAQALRYE